MPNPPGVREVSVVAAAGNRFYPAGRISHRASRTSAPQCLRRTLRGRTFWFTPPRRDGRCTAVCPRIYLARSSITDRPAAFMTSPFRLCASVALQRHRILVKRLRLHASCCARSSSSVCAGMRHVSRVAALRRHVARRAIVVLAALLSPSMTTVAHHRIEEAGDCAGRHWVCSLVCSARIAAYPPWTRRRDACRDAHELPVVSIPRIKPMDPRCAPHERRLG